MLPVTTATSCLVPNCNTCENPVSCNVCESDFEKTKYDIGYLCDGMYHIYFLLDIQMCEIQILLWNKLIGIT